ncbi:MULTISPECIES: RNA polymerase sigma factor [unclassified Sphingomonas]|uniref:RNA polymerase sigma factor n=1 Tax=unclassified Sphingomonas TaxID=196159 RepID=UPI00138F4F54|nr:MULTISPECIES: RNA polymerase sigma factor [unclassified Sphingomonas]
MASATTDMQSSLPVSIASSVAAASATFESSLIAISPRLQRYARSLAQNADAAEDLVQETLLRAWKARAQFVPDTSLSAWTFTIMRNLFFSARRRDRFHGPYDEVSSQAIIATGSNQDNVVDLAKVTAAMALLPEGQRQALHLVAIAGMTPDEAADRIGSPVGTVKSRVSRARTNLKLLLSPQSSRSSAVVGRLPVIATQQRMVVRKKRNFKDRSLVIG